MPADPATIDQASGRLIDTAEFDALLRSGRSLLDLRAPVEFARGALPTALNLPLLTDDERRRVGVCYKQAGPEAALRLGYRLVSDATREVRMAEWCSWADAHPDGVIYCFRGGQRSAIVQDWLAAAGRMRPRVAGGYKALRRHLLGTIDRHAPQLQLFVLGGRTGTGKTRILQRLERSLDLEGLAHHRGSAFGSRVDGQPPPAGFENALAIRILELTASPGPIVVEDESRNIGRLSLPDPLTRNMARSPLIVVESPLEDRVRLTLEDYIVAGLDEHLARHGEAGFEHFAAWLRDALGRIRKRLGGDRYRQLSAALEDALQAQAATGEVDAHGAWIRDLLGGYYDPMYDHQLASKTDRIVFRGEPDAVTEWLACSLPSGHAAG